MGFFYRKSLNFPYFLTEFLKSDLFVVQRLFGENNPKLYKDNKIEKKLLKVVDFALCYWVLIDLDLSLFGKKCYFTCGYIF